MNVEAWKYSEQEKKKREKSEKEKKKEKMKILKEMKRKKEIQEINKTEEFLKKLKDLIVDESHKLADRTRDVIEKAISEDIITKEEIENILEKIEEIESTEDIDRYLQKEDRITSEEYKKALSDDEARVIVMKKLNNALTILYRYTNSGDLTWLNLFSWYLAILDRKLVMIQENHIDIKENLEEVENKVNPKLEEKLNFWQRFIKVFKEIFIN